jgi:putative ABC transport system ATP-binding protein
MFTAPPHSTLATLVGVTRTFTEGTARRTVLDGADLTIARGELLVLLGRSGSGKSTLLNLLAGIDLPTAGSVWVDGVELSAISERERTLFRRRHLGFVFQAYNLLPTLTVEENLLLPLELAGRADRSGRERALDLLERVGLVDRRGSFPDRLSGGEQQRVAVARALVHDPALVLADEPTGNLDLDSGLAVLALLDELTRQAGKTLVMVTHGREVVGLADRVLTLSEGRLAEVEGPSPEAEGRSDSAAAAAA